MIGMVWSSTSQAVMPPGEVTGVIAISAQAGGASIRTEAVTKARIIVPPPRCRRCPASR